MVMIMMSEKTNWSMVRNYWDWVEVKQKDEDENEQLPGKGKCHKSKALLI